MKVLYSDVQDERTETVKHTELLISVDNWTIPLQPIIKQKNNNSKNE